MIREDEDEYAWRLAIIGAMQFGLGVLAMVYLVDLSWKRSFCVVGGLFFLDLLLSFTGYFIFYIWDKINDM